MAFVVEAGVSAWSFPRLSSATAAVGAGTAVRVRVGKRPHLGLGGRRGLSMDDKIDASEFYAEYHGHTIEHLGVLCRGLDVASRPTVWLAGDSSLDNKYWLHSHERVAACHGYERVLGYQKPDVSYHMNRMLMSSSRSSSGTEKKQPYVVVNCAVEESRLVQRIRSRTTDEAMLPQDEFICDHIKHDDVLVVSVGGNDVALKPSARTAWNMFKLVFFNSEQTLKTNPAHAWGMPWFVRMFKDDVSQYISKLMTKNKPQLVVVCMIYFPDEAHVQSWANPALKFLRYDSKPELLQAGIRAIWEEGTTQIGMVDSVPVVGCALFDALDGKHTQDYVARVEPSNAGGAKMASRIVSTIGDYFAGKGC